MQSGAPLTIIDNCTTFAPGTAIGVEAEKDRERYFVSDSGIVVIPRAPEKNGWVTITL